MVHTSQKGKDPSTTPLKMAFNINMTCGTSEYKVEIYPRYPRIRIGWTKDKVLPSSDRTWTKILECFNLNRTRINKIGTFRTEIRTNSDPNKKLFSENL